MTEDNLFPLISVIVPVYNIDRYVAKCAESIMGQTYRNLEIILVDDGSSDQSGVICESIAEKDNRVCVIHQTNAGPSAARNTGINCSRGEYLLFVDGDDYIASEMVERLYSQIVLDSSDLAMCGVARVWEDGSVFREDSVPDAVVTGFQAQEMAYGYKGWLFCSMIVNKLYPKRLFCSVHFPGGRFHEDEASVYKLLDQCSKVSVLSDMLYFYLDRENSTMNSPYSIKRLDGIEASYQRYFYYRKKGGPYLSLLKPEGDLFTPLYFRSKQLFQPSTKEEKERVREIDRMAREICLDNFSAWSLPRKIKLLSPYTYIRIGNLKRKVLRRPDPVQGDVG